MAAAGASILDGAPRNNKWSLNLTGGRRSGGQQEIANCLKGELVDDVDYELEMQKDKYAKEEKDPAAVDVAVPTFKDRKRERQTEGLEWRTERKKMRKEPPLKARIVGKDKNERGAAEVNPLLKIKGKDGTVVFEGSAGGDVTATGSSEAEVTAPAKTPEVDTPTRQPDSVASAAAAAQTRARPGIAMDSTPRKEAVGGFLGSIVQYEEDSSDADEPAEISNCNYLNLNVKMPSKTGPLITGYDDDDDDDAMKPWKKNARPLKPGMHNAKVIPPRSFPSQENTGSSGSAAKAPAAPSAAKAPVDAIMKEMSPALAALMGLDC